MESLELGLLIQLQGDPGVEDGTGVEDAWQRGKADPSADFLFLF